MPGSVSDGNLTLGFPLRKVPCRRRCCIQGAKGKWEGGGRGGGGGGGRGGGGGGTILRRSGGGDGGSLLSRIEVLCFHRHAVFSTQTDRRTETETDRQTQTDRERERDRQRQRQRQREIKSNQNVCMYRPLTRYNVVQTNIHSQFTRFHERIHTRAH